MGDTIIFGETPSSSDKDCVVVEVPCECDTREELFDAFRSALGLPEYFGANWDAFSESLRDLSWVPQRTVVLHHRDRPLRDDHEFKVYLDIIRECVEDWKEGEEHRLVAVFPETCRDVITYLMR